MPSSQPRYAETAGSAQSTMYSLYSESQICSAATTCQRYSGPAVHQLGLQFRVTIEFGYGSRQWLIWGHMVVLEGTQREAEV